MRASWWIAVAAGLVAAGVRAVDGDERSVEELARDCRGSVVTIRFTGRGAGDQGLGTGFVVADGLVATNLHVIGEARPITVETADGRLHEVLEVHASDRDADLAIVRIAAGGLTSLPLGDPQTLVDGQEVVALGNPHGLERSVVAGRVSGRREIDGRPMIQLAIPIEPGNSGGPLLDRQGRVHGILTMKSLVTPNLGFAVGVDQLRGLLDRPNPVAMDRWLTIGALDPREWTTVGGARWRQRAGRIMVSGAGTGFGGRSLCLATAAAPPRPCELAVWVKLDDEAGAAGLVFSADGGDRHYGFYPSAGKLRLTRFEGPDVASWTILAERPSPAYRSGDWNHLRVRLEDGRIACFVNDEPVVESADTALPAGRVGLAKFRDTQATFRGFAIGGEVPRARPSSAALARVEALPLPAGGLPSADVIGGLVAAGPEGDRALVGRAEALERDAARLRTLAAVVHERRTIDALLATVSRPEAEIDLYTAALLVARLDNPDVDVAAATADLDALARDVRDRLPADAGPTDRLDMLDRVLFRELGFHGSRGDYYNRANSYVNEVFDDREGIPITLAIVYIELARRLDLVVHGIGLPGHFIARFDPPAGDPVWIDVFDGGTRLSLEGVAALLRDVSGMELADEHLAVMPSRAIVVRMLNNLLGVATRQRDDAATLRCLDALVALDSDAVRERVLRMVVATRLDRPETALDDARWLLVHQPPEIDLAAVERLVADLEAKSSR